MCVAGKTRRGFLMTELVSGYTIVLDQAMTHAGKEPFPVIMVDGKNEGEVCAK